MPRLKKSKRRVEKAKTIAVPRKTIPKPVRRKITSNLRHAKELMERELGIRIPRFETATGYDKLQKRIAKYDVSTAKIINEIKNEVAKVGGYGKLADSRSGKPLLIQISPDRRFAPGGLTHELGHAAALKFWQHTRNPIGLGDSIERRVSGETIACSYEIEFSPLAHRAYTRELKKPSPAFTWPNVHNHAMLNAAAVHQSFPNSIRGRGRVRRHLLEHPKAMKNLAGLDLNGKIEFIKGMFTKRKAGEMVK